MPTIAISGRWRFGGFKAAMMASASSVAIGGAAAIAGSAGNVSSAAATGNCKKSGCAETAP